MQMRIFLALLLLSTSAAFAQTDLSPKYYIPYFDHGKWGWCDTLGKVVVQPEFASCSFFESKGKYWVSDVTKENRNYEYVLGKGMLPVANCGLDFWQYTQLTDKNWWIVRTTSRKYGIYDWGKQRFVLDTIAKSIVMDETYLSFLCYKKENATKFSVFNLKTQKSTESEMTDDYWSGETQKTYFRKSYNDKWHELSPKGAFVETMDDVEEVYFAMDGDDYAIEQMDSERALEYQVVSPSTVRLTNGGIPYSTTRINRVDYAVFKKDGKFGLINLSNNSVVLENTYDFIDINYSNGYFFLIKDGKMGLKMMGTIYPAIEPKYDMISEYNSLRVNSRWSFVLYEVLLDGNKMYVGENGVEYFKR